MTKEGKGWGTVTRCKESCYIAIFNKAGQYSLYFTYYMNDKLQNGCVLYIHMYCVVFFDRGLFILLNFITILILSR